MKNFRNYTDKIAISLSLLCTIHCLVFPILLVLVPSLTALSIMDDCLFHQWMLVGVLPTSLFALTVGCRKHRQWPLLILGLAGVSLLSLTAFWGHDLFGCKGEKYMTLFGSCLVVIAHFLNYRQCQKRSCH
ncbi:MAG: MerC domain-containing protein [Bacteroidota bacterium]